MSFSRSVSMHILSLLIGIQMCSIEYECSHRLNTREFEQKKTSFSFVKCYLYSSHWEHTNAKRWHNTLARHSKQFTLHSHHIHLNRHTQTITCLLNLLRFVVDLFPFFCHNTVSIIIYNQHDPLFAVPIYPFFLSFKRVACTLDLSTAHMEAAFESVQFLRCVLTLFFRFLLLFVRYFYFTYNLFHECNWVCWKPWGWT